MKWTKELDTLVMENNGYLLTADAVTRGIPRSYISRYATKNGFERMAHGVYASADAWPDYEYVIGLRNKEVIFSHESALAMHGLMEREAPGIIITVNRTYNATHLRKLGCRVYTTKPDLYTLGLIEGTTFFGNRVRLYDVERTICDIIRSKKNIQMQTYQNAIQEYMAYPGKNLQKLLEYAILLGVENTVKTYMEMMS